MLTIADRWRLSLPDPWLVPLDLPWDWDPCLRPCKSSSTPSPPNPSLTTWPPSPQSPSPPNPSLTSWPAALSSPSSPISNYKKMNQTLFWDLYISRSKCFSSWWSWPSWCLRLSLQNIRCLPSHYLLFSLYFCVCLSFLSVFVFVFVFFICLCVCVCLFICLCLCCHCCQIFSIYLVNITNEFRWTSSSFGSCVLDTTPAYSLSQQVIFVPTFIIISIIIMSLLIFMSINIIIIISLLISMSINIIIIVVIIIIIIMFLLIYPIILQGSPTSRGWYLIVWRASLEWKTKMRNATITRGDRSFLLLINVTFPHRSKLIYEFYAQNAPIHPLPW